MRHPRRHADRAGSAGRGTPFSPDAIAEIFAGLVAETSTDRANWHTLLNLTKDGVTHFAAPDAPETPQ